MRTTSYLTIRPDAGIVHRTIQVSPSTLVDVDVKGRVIGIEALNGSIPNYLAVLNDDRFRFVAEESA